MNLTYSRRLFLTAMRRLEMAATPMTLEGIADEITTKTYMRPATKQAMWWHMKWAMERGLCCADEGVVEKRGGRWHLTELGRNIARDIEQGAVKSDAVPLLREPAVREVRRGVRKE